METSNTAFLDLSWKLLNAFQPSVSAPSVCDQDKARVVHDLHTDTIVGAVCGVLGGIRVSFHINSVKILPSSKTADLVTVSSNGC